MMTNSRQNNYYNQLRPESKSKMTNTNTSASSKPANNGCLFEPGQYTAKIKSAMHKSHSCGFDVIQLWLEAYDNFGGVDILPKIYNLNSIGSRDFMKRELEKIGVNIESRKDVINAPSKLEGLKVDISLGYNESGFPVIYFNDGKQDDGQFDPDSLWD